MTTTTDLTQFDDVEILPVREDPDDGACEPVPDAPHTASFWTVYGHRKEGGVTALIDCADERSADVAGFILEQALAVPRLVEALRTLIDRADDVIGAVGNGGGSLDEDEISTFSDTAIAAEEVLTRLEAQAS